MPERPFGTDSAEEQQPTELNENSPANNNEQSGEEDDEEYQSDDEEEEVCFIEQIDNKNRSFIDYFRTMKMNQHLTLLMMTMDRIFLMMVAVLTCKKNLIGFLFFCLVLCPELMAERPQEHESLNNIIVVDNLPKVDEQKLDKLKAVISKVYSKFGVCRNEYYPLDKEGKTKG
jgi:hypothetical protein